MTMTAIKLTTGERFYGGRDAATPALITNTEAVAPTAEDGSTPLYVYVNHGRWMVKCPDCPSAQVAFEGNRRFYCAECLNVMSGGKYLVITWPSKEEQEQIEMLLAHRPIINKNWNPGETMELLRFDNELHQVGPQEKNRQTIDALKGLS